MPIARSMSPDPTWAGSRETPQRTLPTSARAKLWRAGLAGVCLATGLLGMHAGDPTTYLQSDPELARLLRGMALIKAALVLAAIAVIWWRYARPLSRGLSTAYLAGIAAMTFAAATVWQLSHLASASILFHAGIFLLLGCAYLDTAGPADA